MSGANIKLPLKEALFWILLPTLLISGTTTLGLLYFQHIKEMHMHDDAYRIVALMQTAPENEGLKTVYLAELFDLSIDRPSNLYRFNTKEARRKLLSNPLIRDARIKKIRPGTLYVDYTMRKPAAFLTDYANTMIDRERYLFPYKPFFAPKRLPEIYLGLPLQSEKTLKEPWGVSIEGPQVDLAFSLLDYLETKFCTNSCQLKRIDVSNAYALSCGQRQIVLIVEDRIEHIVNGKTTLYLLPRILRLNTDNYLQGLANYTVLNRHLLQQEKLLLMPQAQPIVRLPLKIIDLRLPQLAFISK